MSALATRAYVQATGNYYLTPLALVGNVPTALADWITAAVEHHVKLQPLYDVDGQNLLGQGYTCTTPGACELRRRQISHTSEGTLAGTERVLVVRSDQFAQHAVQ